MTNRTLAASILAIFALVAFGGLYFTYQRADDARHVAEQSVGVIRVNRRLTEFKICQAVNAVRRINNRDRLTFIRSISETRRDMRLLHDPVLHAILLRSIVQSEHELAIRPHLPTLSCVDLVLRPEVPNAPPALTTLTTTG